MPRRPNNNLLASKQKSNICIWIRLFILRFLPCCLILITLPPHFSHAWTSDHQKPRSALYHNVLLLHSYHKGFQWTDDISRGIESVFHDQNSHIRLYTDYMDTKRIHNESYLKVLYNLFSCKYKYLKFDLVIVSDDNAFNFIKKYHDPLFPQIPVVFCGVNYFREVEIEGLDYITGVTEEVAIQAVFELALHLHPETHEIVIINDTTTTGRKIHEKMAKIIPWYWDRVRFVLLEDVTMTEIQNAVSRLTKGSLVFYTLFFRDKTDQFFESNESLRLIARDCRVPIYGACDINLGNGIVGGMLTSGFFQGKSAAHIALRILSGTDVRNIPVLKKSPNRYMFDYRQLKHFKIDLKALPKDSIVINRPYSFYYKNKKLVWGMASCLAALTAIILVLMVNILKRKRAEKALLKANQRLEYRVAERTNDLLQANRQLKNEIEERFKADEQLRESEETYRNLVERANDGIIIIQEGIIKYANPRMAELIKLSLSNIQGSHYADHVHHDERKRVTENYDLRMKGENVPQIYETVLSDPDGRKIAVELNAGRITYKGETANLVIIRDVSERKKMEQELLKIKRLESIGFLAGGIAHDFNNILAAIMGNLELSKYTSEAGSRIHNYLDEAIAAALKAKGLTQKLITFAKGGMSLKQVTDIRPMLIECVHLILDNTGIAYTTDLDQDLWSLNVDQRRISQAIQYILTNAREAFKNPMAIRISAKNLLLSPDSGLPLPSGRYVKIEIKDDGKGMSPEILENIFDPYYSSKTLNSEKGVGMGLAICHSVITNHGGHITVDSEPDVGSTFIIYLPAIANQIQTDNFSPHPHLMGNGRILVMDDEEMIRLLAKRILQTLGYECNTAKDGEEAVRLFADAHRKDSLYDAVILDLSVPEGMGGMETTQQLKAIDPDIKIIVSSGYSNDPIMHDHYAYGFVSNLPKPYTVNEVGRILRTVLSQ